MIIVEDLTLAGANIPPDDTEHFYNIPIPFPWMKIAYIKLVQLTGGPMECVLAINELDNLDDGDRTKLYAQVVRRHIKLGVTEGAQYAEAPNQPIPYKDRETSGRNLHIALINCSSTGIASDFALTIKLADIGEVV